MTKKIIFLFIVFISVIASCKSDGDEVIDGPDTSVTVVKDVDESAVIKIIESFPSPIEMAASIKDMNTPYSKKYLINTDSVTNFDSNFKKSLGLGMLSADLGYLNVYSRTNEILEYLTSIKRISDELDIDQFFDFQTLKRLAANNDNLDSLMFLSVNSYLNMSKHLRDTRRSDLSALMITGVWIEGLYLACKVNELTPSEDLKKRIGGQRAILSDLILILKFFENKAHFATVIKEFEILQEAYEGVTVTIEMGETKGYYDKDSIWIVDPGEKTIINITDEQLLDISNQIITIRNKLISL